MSLASWKSDPKLQRESHKWCFSRVEVFEKTVGVIFYCENPGCQMTVWRQVEKPDPKDGLCFDSKNSIQLTDREGNELPPGTRGYDVER